MKVGNYKVSWRHVRNVFNIKKGNSIINKGINPKGGRTECLIEDENRKEISFDCCICHITDTYDKNKGRKLSLQRALSKAGFPKEDRIKFFDKYFEEIDKSISRTKNGA